MYCKSIVKQLYMNRKIKELYTRVVRHLKQTASTYIHTYIYIYTHINGDIDMDVDIDIDVCMCTLR